MQPKRFFGQVSHIPSQRSGFVGLLQDLIHISTLQNNYKISEPVLSPSEESHVVDEAKKGNKTAQEKLVDHYDTLAANAYLKAYSVKDEEERRKYLRQWCFYASRAEETDCPWSIKDIQRLEKQFYIEHPPKEAKRLSSIHKETLREYISTLFEALFQTVAGIFGVWLFCNHVSNNNKIDAFYIFSIIMVFIFIIISIGGIIWLFSVLGRGRKNKKIYTCGNCGDKVESSIFTCPTCKTILKD
jgi:lipopolysaccharide biosynthesis regulator YciM